MKLMFIVVPIIFAIVALTIILRVVSVIKRGTNIAKNVKNLFDSDGMNDLKSIGQAFSGAFETEASKKEAEKEKQYVCEYCQCIIKESQTKCPNCGAMRKTTKD